MECASFPLGLIREFDLISSNDLNIADQQESDAAVVS